jgi:hypothetical protein
VRSGISDHHGRIDVRSEILRARQRVLTKARLGSRTGIDAKLDNLLAKLTK